MKPRIVFVINSLVGGGAERVMTTLLAHSNDRAREFDISLAVLDDEPRAFDVPDWLTVHQLDCRHGTVASIRQLGNLIRRTAPSATLSFLTRSNVASVIASLRGSHRSIISERTSTSAHLGRGVRPAITKMMIRAFYPRASRVIAPSQDIAAKLQSDFGVRAQRIDVIPNPVDVEALQRASADDTAFEVGGDYVMALGRLVPVKNYELLIRAFAAAAIPGRLVIAGDGPERAHLESVARELGIADRLVLPGFLQNPYRALKGARVFALSSNVEGFPNALLEALALEVPVVATNCRDGPAGIVANSSAERIEGLKICDAGILTPVGDVETFAHALRLAIEDPLRSRLAAQGAALASQYSAASIVERYWQVIERAIASQARPGSA